MLVTQAPCVVYRVWARSHANEVVCMAYVDDKTKCLADTANACAWDDEGSSCYGVDGTALRLLVVAKFSPKSGYDVPRMLACPGEAIWVAWPERGKCLAAQEPVAWSQTSNTPSFTSVAL